MSALFIIVKVRGKTRKTYRRVKNKAREMMEEKITVDITEMLGRVGEDQRAN